MVRVGRWFLMKGLKCFLMMIFGSIVLWVCFRLRIRFLWIVVGLRNGVC